MVPRPNFQHKNLFLDQNSTEPKITVPVPKTFSTLLCSESASESAYQLKGYTDLPTTDWRAPQSNESWDDDSKWTSVCCVVSPQEDMVAVGE